MNLIKQIHILFYNNTTVKAATSTFNCIMYFTCNRVFLYFCISTFTKVSDLFCSVPMRALCDARDGEPRSVNATRRDRNDMLLCRDDQQ